MLFFLAFRRTRSPNPTHPVLLEVIRFWGPPPTAQVRKNRLCEGAHFFRTLMRPPLRRGVLDGRCRFDDPTFVRSVLEGPDPHCVEGVPKVCPHNLGAFLLSPC